MSSPARRHFERASAAQSRAAEAPAHSRDANSYELMLLKLAEDKRRLKDVQSMERKAEVKRQILPEYAPWVEGVLAGQQGVQDDVLMTVMVWRIDAGDLDGALQIARYAIEHQLTLPDQYKRTTACLIAEEVSDIALRDLAAADAGTMVVDANLLASQLGQVDEITAEEDMPDEVRAKLQKAIGYALRGLDKPAALTYLNRAIQLHDKVGVKKDIERLEREIKNTDAPAS
ncbi:MAG: hypothetical protein HY849_00170 [Nitrosomonadales bacterium]|nr:hypothetical protein [Nitrosomonadales bacterium]